MDPALSDPMAKRPLDFLSPHGGQETLLEQRQMDGNFSIAAKCFNKPPTSSIQQPVNPPQPPLTASSDGALVFPTQQPKCGSSSAGLGHAVQQPSSLSHPGVTFQIPGGHAPAGHQLLSINERLLHCSLLINQLIEQQQVLQALFTTPASPQSAMAAPPSSPFPQPSRLFEVRTSTRPEQAPTNPTESYEARRDVPLRACGRTDSELHEYQEGGKTSQEIQKGRKCNNSAEPKRQCEDEPLEVQVWLEHSVGSGTSDVNGKQFGSPAPQAAVSATAATGKSQRLSGESTRDVIVCSTQHRKIVLASEEPAQHLGTDGVNDDDCCCFVDAPASTVNWTTVSATNQLDQQRPASYAIEDLDQNILLVGHPERAPPAVVARILFVKINSSQLQQHTTPQANCVDIADDCLQLFIDQHRGWPEPGEVKAFVNQPPPWPPPAVIIVLLLIVEPMPDPSPNSTCSSTQEASSSSSTSTTFTCLRR